ncbi:MAG: homoserine kinase [Pseudomonadota bacterium]
MKQRAVAFAPASIGNVGVGFDILGLAIENVGDVVTAQRTSTVGVSIREIEGDNIGHEACKLSTVANENTASIAAAALWNDHGEGGLCLSLKKGTPLGSGMGSSAASAVAAVVATNALLPTPLEHIELLEYAMQGEAYASGARHADNVAPSLLGGLILCPTRNLPSIRELPTPSGLVSVLVHPHCKVNTADARQALSTDVSLPDAVSQMGLVAWLVDACHRRDAADFGRSIVDMIVEPQRASLVPGFDAVKAAAIDAGALGCSLSGSGPSVFAIVNKADADAVCTRMVAAFSDHGLNSNAWVSDLDAPGAIIIE